MTVFDAEALIGRYRDSPPCSPLGEAARVNRLIQTLHAGLTDLAAKHLYERLGGTKLSRHYGSDPIWDLLFELIDHRPQLGIPALKADEDYSCLRHAPHMNLE